MKKILFFSFILISHLGFAQELPPIVKYPPSSYNAGNQNWMISQDKNNFVYFANNEGLLEFNGSDWTIYPSPNETIMRSVKVIDEKIYTGCYMEFGFWKRLSNGQLKYTSLSSKVKSKILDDEQFWSILHFDHWVIFQSLNQLFIYDTKTSTFEVITPKSGIFKAYITSKSIFYQTVSEGLFEIENGKGKLFSKNPFFIQNRIISIFKQDNSFLFLTQYNGFYEYKNEIIQKWVTDSDPEINSSSIYCAQKNSDNSIVFGTVSNGIFIIDSNGKTKYHITQNKGIGNNTVLSLFEDTEKNIWIGLDNGINCINLSSPIFSYTDNTGILGTVYTSILKEGKLYIGTNQGLFYKNIQEDDNFKFISGTKGQVWSLFLHDNSLFCGHDLGTFLIENQTAIPIFSASGTWKFEPIESNKNILLQGNYYGLSVLEKVNNSWRFRNKINGFDYSSKYFEITKPGEIIVSHEYKGIFRVKTNPTYSTVSYFETYKNPGKGKNAGLTKFNSKIYYALKEGIFTLNTNTNQFEKDKTLSNVFDKNEYISGKMMVDQSNRLWLFTKCKSSAKSVLI